ncbi:SGNH hydrolase-type esterase domain-containing protein, partial [Pelagophyceae sp. CCMP2097]
MLAAAVAAWDAKIGDVGNVCPSGYEKITSWVACRAALDVVGLANDKYEGVEDAPDWPSGCYYCKSCGREVWFNSHATGAAAEDTNAKPICAKDLEPLTAKTLFLGDSDMDYYPTKDDFPDSHNLGYAGYNCNEVNVDLDAGLLFAGIEWVVLVCGENDLAEGTSVADTYNRFETAVSEITAYGAQVLSLGTKPEPDSHDLWQKYQELDQLYIGLAQTKASSFSNFAPLVFIDTYQNFLELGTGSWIYFQFLGNSNSFYIDDLHLSTQGYAYWTSWATKGMA